MTANEKRSFVLKNSTSNTCKYNECQSRHKHTIAKHDVQLTRCTRCPEILRYFPQGALFFTQKNLGCAVAILCSLAYDINTMYWHFGLEFLTSAVSFKKYLSVITDKSADLMRNQIRTFWISKFDFL